MQRLIKENLKNGPEEYDRIFKIRSHSESNWQDVRRWKTLMKEYQGGYVIDLGCLDSGIYDLFWDKMYDYRGIDLAKDSIDRMNRRIGAEYVYKVGDLMNVEVGDNFFDYAILGEVLEHLEEPEKAIKEAYRILKPGGILAISVPLEEAREPGAVDSERHLWSFSKDDFVHLLKDFKKIKMKILRSQYFPKYKYAWPSLIVYAWK